MSESMSSDLIQTLLEIDKQGLLKQERYITSPQSTHIHVRLMVKMQIEN